MSKYEVTKTREGEAASEAKQRYKFCRNSNCDSSYISYDRLQQVAMKNAIKHFYLESLDYVLFAEDASCTGTGYIKREGVGSSDKCYDACKMYNKFVTKGCTDQDTCECFCMDESESNGNGQCRIRDTGYDGYNIYEVVNSG